MSALCQKQTFAVQQFGQLLDHLVARPDSGKGTVNAQLWRAINCSKTDTKNHAANNRTALEAAAGEIKHKAGSQTISFCSGIDTCPS